MPPKTPSVCDGCSATDIKSRIHPFTKKALCPDCMETPENAIIGITDIKKEYHLKDSDVSDLNMVTEPKPAFIGGPDRRWYYVADVKKRAEVVEKRTEVEKAKKEADRKEKELEKEKKKEEREKAKAEKNREREAKKKAADAEKAEKAREREEKKKDKEEEKKAIEEVKEAKAKEREEKAKVKAKGDKTKDKKEKPTPRKRKAVEENGEEKVKRRNPTRGSGRKKAKIVDDATEDDEE